MFKRAFTLAEILITIAVIGVVAALTIPLIYNYYQNKQLKVAFKKAYTVLYQAWTQAYANNELTDPGYWSGTVHYQAIKSRMNVVKNCTWPWTSCYPSGESCEGTPSGNSPAFIDSAGMTWTNHESANILVVDVNGYNKPNVCGKDRFVFHFTSSKSNANKILIMDDTNLGQINLFATNGVPNAVLLDTTSANGCPSGGCDFSNLIGP